MRNKNNEIYVSVDIEADGPIPGVNSMLNVGMAAFDLTTKNPIKPIATYEANLIPLEDAVQDEFTMTEFWDKQPEAWAYVTSNQREPSEVIQEIIEWAGKLPGKPVMVVYPTYDFMWLYWYMVRFGGEKGRRAYSFSALDIKSLAMGHLGLTFKSTAKRRMPKHWFKDSPKHDHTGLTDAIGQGMLFVNMMRDLRDR